MRHLRKAAAVFLFLGMLTAFCFPGEARAENAGNRTNAEACGEWEMILRARGTEALSPAEAAAMYGTLEKKIAEKKGVLSQRKYTEYAKAVLAVTALGYSAENVAGYNLIPYLNDYDKVLLQGINGPVWALTALDAGAYPSDIRGRLVDTLLSRELPSGGWNMEGKGTADPDVTAMVLTALCGYRDRKDVEESCRRALSVLSGMQCADGSFVSCGAENCESCAQVVIALCTFAIAPDDPAFVKNGHSVLDALSSYRLSDGTFMHTRELNRTDALSTEQGKLALAAVERFRKKMTPLYRMKEK